MFRRLPSPNPGDASLHNPQADIRPSRTPLRTGMEYSMLYDNRVMEAPNVPPPTRRSSLAQQHLIHRYQNSKYFSRLRNFGLRPDYPAFHGFAVINQGNATQFTPRSKPTPIGPRPLAGSMRPPRRFAKALPASRVSYVPPTY